MTSELTRKLAAGALGVVGVLHLILAPEYLGEQLYVGVLFILGGIALCGMAVRLWRTDDVPSWLLGALTMAAMGIGFILSRTTGLPGFHESEWSSRGSSRSCSSSASSGCRSAPWRRARPWLTRGTALDHVEPRRTPRRDDRRDRAQHDRGEPGSQRSRPESRSQARAWLRR